MLGEGFFFSFFIWFGIGIAFARLTRPARDRHGWNVFNWSLEDLSFEKAGRSLLVFAAFFALSFMLSFWKARRKAAKQ